MSDLICSYCGEHYIDCHDYDLCVARCITILERERDNLKRAEKALEKAKATQSQNWWKVGLAIKKMQGE